MDAKRMKEALGALDKLLTKDCQLLIGGGAAFLLAHQISLSTVDMDAVPYQTSLSAAELDGFVKKVAARLKIPSDWLNTYFATFTYSLPKDYGSRLVKVFQGKRLTAKALGKEDLLIMKCFAGREKDIMHAKLLLKKNLDGELVSKHLHRCVEENLPSAPKALDFFYEICEQLGIDV